MKFGIIVNPALKNSTELCKKIKNFLLSHNQEVYIEKHIAEKLGLEGVTLTNMNVDILITVGGDGTILRCLQCVKNVKIFGINAGGLGFLTETEVKDMIPSIERILAGNYTTDKRIKLKTCIDGERSLDCTNDAVIYTGKIARMCRLEVFVNESLALDLRADGIIIATPTGSTSYSLSVGGPIIDPKVSAICIAPIAPFALSARPLVVSSDSTITVKLGKNEKNAILVLDGQTEIPISPKNTLKFTASEFYAEFVRFNLDFYTRIKEKLG